MRKSKVVTLMNYNLTDFGNAERLHDMFGKTWKYLEEYKTWLHWDGHHWKSKNTLQACWAAAEAFQTLAEEIYRLPAPEDDFELKRRLRIITWLQRSKCNYRSKNALLFLRGMLESGQF